MTNPYLRPAQPAPRPQRSPLVPWLVRLPLLAATAFMLLFFLVALYLALHQLQHDKLIIPACRPTASIWAA
jgi:hypothetical protein